MKLEGRTAIVTGGAVRIGRAIALALGQQGCHVVLHYGSSATEAEQTAESIRSNGVKSLTVQADFLKPEAAANAVFEAALKEFEAIDILINSAAIFEEGTLAEVTEDHFDRHCDINLKSPLFLAQQFARRLSSGGGHIVNVADWRATRPIPGHLSYTITKSALVGMTRILAQELGPRIQVNAVAPGAILPPPGADPQYLDSIASRIPLRRVGTTEDVTRAVLFLLQSEFLTGETIHVAGGEQM